MGLRENLAALAANPYPGRGICVGLSDTGKSIFQVYWIMGRSANSRNRVFAADGATLRTAPADASKVEDASLIIYNAMLELPKVYIATNGDQTDTIQKAVASGGSFPQALRTRTYEPDAPNYTARISCMCDLRGAKPDTYLSVIVKTPFGEGAERHCFEYETLPRGAGYTVTTYAGDGTPLPRFAGEPYLLPLDGNAEEAAETIWYSLNEANRVSLAIKAIDVSTGKSDIHVINAYRVVS